jgi:hypothetical protein
MFILAEAAASASYERTSSGSDAGSSSHSVVTIDDADAEERCGAVDA